MRIFIESFLGVLIWLHLLNYIIQITNNYIYSFLENWILDELYDLIFWLTFFLNEHGTAIVIKPLTQLAFNIHSW